MAGILRTDTIQNSNTSTLITQTNSTTITIGTSGQTIALASGASSSGFGATYNGAVNWDTTPKTTGFTAVSGNGYFVNTTSGAITVTLPASPSAGAIVSIADYANTAATNKITVGRNSSKIDGETIDGTISTNGQVYTLIYVDATEGWKTVGQTFNQIATAQYVAATGGTVTTCGNYKIHTFTGPGTFCVSNAGNPGGSSTVDYLVVAGGGGGGASGYPNREGGGGGAGGYRESVPFPAAWTASPLANPGGALPVSVQGYPITVGGGGPGSSGPGPGTNGSNSIFSTITSTGGGYGSVRIPSGARNAGSPGGSGGGGGNTPIPCSAGTGNTPPVSPPQGNPGGGATSSPENGAGGGGAGAAGSPGTPGGSGAGGPGATSSINGTPTARAGGGGGYGQSGYGPSAPGGGGSSGGAGTVNTGGGGGAAAPGATGGTGGSGVVIIRYKYQ